MFLKNHDCTDSDWVLEKSCFLFRWHCITIMSHKDGNRGKNKTKTKQFLHHSFLRNINTASASVFFQLAVPHIESNGVLKLYQFRMITITSSFGFHFWKVKAFLRRQKSETWIVFLFSALLLAVFYLIFILLKFL